MLENARNEKWRFHPDGVERRNGGEETDGLRNNYERGPRRMLDLPGGNESNGALMLTLSRAGMEALVPLRRNRQNEGEDESGKQSDCQASLPGGKLPIASRLDAHCARNLRAGSIKEQR